MQVYLIRHTRVGVEKGICYGQTDVDVANSFEQEAALYDVSLPNDFDEVYSSPLKRCVKLAQYLNRGIPLLDDRLKEINFGSWENQKWDTIPVEDLKVWSEHLDNYKEHQGENLVELNQRVKAFIQDCLTKGHSKILIVAHAGVIRCFWQYILQFSITNTMKIPVDFHEIFIAELHNDPTQSWIVKKG